MIRKGIIFLITIIVTIYNVQRYLYRCLVSIQNQSFKNIEVILVDDGSTDDSGIICKEFTKVDSRFRYYFQKNSGVSKAKNTGIQHAHGNFLTFVDSDDYLDVNHISSMVMGMENNNIDIAISGRKTITKDKHVQIIAVNKNTIRTADELIKDSFNQIVYGYSWNKLYKTEIIQKHHILFLENLSYAEDLVFNITYLKNSNGGIILKEPTYNYVRRPNSITRSKDKSGIVSRMTWLDAMQIVINLLDYNDTYHDEVQFLYTKIAYEASVNFSRMSQYSFSKQEVDACKSVAINAYNQSYNSMPIIQRLKYKTYLVLPKLTNSLSRIKVIINK